MSEVKEVDGTRQTGNLEQPPMSAESAAKAAESLVPAQRAGMPETAQTFFAVVNADGTLARGFQANSSQRLATGQYEVIFAHDLTGSAYVATIGSSQTSGTEPTGEITVVGRAGAANGVFITTTDSAGVFADRGFHLAVHS
jgi:hypothetical protein